MEPSLPLPEYTLRPDQISNAHNRGINRRNIEVFQKAQQTKARARSAANRLLRSIRTNDEAPDPSMVGLYQKLRRIGDTRVVGSSWRSPRPGRRA